MPERHAGETAAPLLLDGNPATDTAAARQLHAGGVVGAAYSTILNRQVAAMFPDDPMRESAMLYVRDALARMAPRDPLEEMLVGQAILAHARAMHLALIAPNQTSIDGVRVVNEYADRAANTFRRMTLALAEYRRPPRAGDSFTAIRQANIAQQQVVVNDDEKSRGGNATNEQGCGEAAPRGRTRPEALPADARGASVPPSLSDPHTPLAAIDGASHR
jgi:hypothetical protein